MNLQELSEQSLKTLRDRAWLEDAVWRLGVYPAEEAPKPWWQTDGEGIGICQFPAQLAPYLIALSKLKLKAYAEIGVWVAGTFSTTVTYLRRFGLERALGIDIEIKSDARRFVERNEDVMMLEAPSGSPEAKKTLQAFKPDLVFIDGDHTEEGCRADLKLARSVQPKWIAMHDIVDYRFPGVGQVWSEIAEPKQEWTEHGELGLGLVKGR